MILLAIDPGTTESAWVEYDTEKRAVVQWAKEPNVTVLRRIEASDAANLSIEMIASYGMAVGREVFETCVWIGRFVQIWENILGDPARLVYRKEVKMHLCGSARAKDPNVRQALIDRFGGSKEAAIGKKATPGPLYGLSGDGWAALGVAVTATETPKQVVPSPPTQLG